MRVSVLTRFTSAQKQEGKPCRGLSTWKIRAPGTEKALNLQMQGVWDESGTGLPTANMLLQDYGAMFQGWGNTVYNLDLKARQIVSEE